MGGSDEKARQRILANIDALGLNENLLELETNGFTVIPGALSGDQVARARDAILCRVAQKTGKTIDPEAATAADFRGMEYQHYLMFDDPVFAEILLEPKPLALITYLLGESCVLSSMGSHFRGPSGVPLAVHADGAAVGMNETSQVANCNYALTPYSAESGALVMFPGSHRKNRQPTAHENWQADGEPISRILRGGLSETEVDALEWSLPAGAVTLEIAPGDAVIWHGNTWHGGWRRDRPGARINLSAYFCRPHLATQERRGDRRFPEVFERFADDPRFARLMGERVFNGWREEGPDFTGAKDAPTGFFD